MSTTADAFAIALQHHRAGQLPQAERIYREILRIQPHHLDALNLLGVVAYQTGRAADAVEYLRLAVRMAPQVADFHANLGNAYRALGRWDEASACYERSLELNPHLAETHNNLGNTLRQQGRLAEAAARYERALQLEPQLAEAQMNLGTVLADLGQFEAAIARYRAALRLAPDLAGAYRKLGAALHALGRDAEAAACCSREPPTKPSCAGLDPTGLDDRHRRAGPASTGVLFAGGPPSVAAAAASHGDGVALYKLGRYEEAVAAFQRAVQRAPQDAVAYKNLGGALNALGRHEEALAAAERALQLQPDYPEAHHNLGSALYYLGRHVEAIVSYRRALQLKPDYALAHNSLAAALNELEVHDEALAAAQRALQLAPDYAEAHNSLGVALSGLERYAEALISFQRALQLRPHYAAPYTNVGVVLTSQGRFAEAVAALQRGLQIRPDDAETHNSLGNAFAEQGQRDEAVACFGRALELDPGLVEATWNRALVRLLQGDFVRGWPDYESRWEVKPMKYRRREFPQPPWNGESLAGQTIFIYAEQGLGDTLQFVRYVPLLKPWAPRTVFECQPALRPLLTGVAGIDELIAAGDPLPDFDVQIPLLSLPRVFRTDQSNIPSARSYLAANPRLIECWRERLRPIDGFRIGINWQGRQGVGPWRQRDIPLTQFGVLAEIPGVRLISLQHGEVHAELAAVQTRIPIVELGPEVDRQSGAFMDTAAIMMNLDLVITSDTAVPHLAGALGVPVWVALHFVPDWRWLLDREDSPWYPTMRLFRQEERGCWGDVFQRMAAALREQLGRKSVTREGTPGRATAAGQG